MEVCDHYPFFAEPDEGEIYQQESGRGVVYGVILAVIVWGLALGPVWIAYCFFHHKHFTPWGW